MRVAAAFGVPRRRESDAVSGSVGNFVVSGLDTPACGRYKPRTFAAGGEFPRRHGGKNASTQETQTLLLTALSDYGCTRPRRRRAAVLCRCISAVPPRTGRRGFVLR